MSEKLQVYSSEQNKIIEVGEDVRREAAYVHQQVIAGSIITAMGITRMFDGELYTGLGCGSKDEYIAEFLPFGRSATYGYYKIGKKFLSAMPELSGSVHSGGQLPESVEGVSGLGYKKLLELTKISDAEFVELVETGKTNVNGEDLQIEEIKDAAFRKAQEIIRKATGEYKEKLSKATGEKATLEETVKNLKKQVKTYESMIETANEKEKLFGPAAKQIEENMTLIKEALGHLTNFKLTMVRIDVTVDSPDIVRSPYENLVKLLHEYHAQLVENYGGIVE